MVVLSKSTGAGAPERNWADVKVVYDKKKTSSNPGRVEKKTKIYGMSRRDPTLSGKLSSSLKDDAWTEEGGMWDGLGLSKWDYAEATELAKYATGRRFKKYIEEAHDGAISNQKVEHGATLVAKYKGIRLTRTLERAPTTAFGPTCSHGRARGAVAGWPPATRCHRATPPRTLSRTQSAPTSTTPKCTSSTARFMT